MTKVILKKGNHPRIFTGHPWVYANEIGSVSASIAPGEIIEVHDSRNRFIGRGYYNAKSQITVRLLTRLEDEQIDESFFRKRLMECFEYRKKLGFNGNYRLVFGESDFLPGLIIDKFGNNFVIQALSLGMDCRKTMIVSALMSLFSPDGIYERDDVPVRKLEGLEEKKGFLTASFATKLELEELGVKFMIDVENGQKTGFFLDQKENRMALQHIANDAEVLDCFCYTGSFSLFAAHFGAKRVHGLDVSESAVAQATENAALNGFENRCRFETANAIGRAHV